MNASTQFHLTIEEAKNLSVHPAAAAFPSMSQIDLDRLKEDLANNYQIDPIVIDQDNLSPTRSLVDGRSRIRALDELGQTHVAYVFWHDLASHSAAIVDRAMRDYQLHLFIVSRNLARRDLSEDQRVMTVVTLKEHFQAECAKALKNGQIKGGKTAGRGRGRPRKNSSRPNSDESYSGRDYAKENANSLEGRIALRAGVSRHKVTQALNLINSRNPELINAVRAGTISLAGAIRKLMEQQRTTKRVNKAEALSALATETADFYRTAFSEGFIKKQSDKHARKLMIKTLITLLKTELKKIK